MQRASLKYVWLTYRRDQLWFPAALLVLFLVFVLALRHPAARFTLARAYLGFVLPLSAGLLAAYAVLDDPALELRFATPQRALTTLLERVGLILGVHAVAALAFEVAGVGLGIDLAPFGGVFERQLLWLVPMLALTALGAAGSLAGAQNVVGAFLVGGLWLVELMMRGWCEQNAKPLFVFLGVFAPADPALLFNRCTLLGVALGLLLVGWRLLLRRERYL